MFQSDGAQRVPIAQQIEIFQRTVLNRLRVFRSIETRTNYIHIYIYVYIYICVCVCVIQLNENDKFNNTS